MERSRLFSIAVLLYGGAVVVAYASGLQDPGIASTLFVVGGAGMFLVGLVGLVRPDATFLGGEFTSDDVPTWLVVVLALGGLAILAGLVV